MKAEKNNIKVSREESGRVIDAVFQTQSGFEKRMKIPADWLRIVVKIPHIDVMRMVPKEDAYSMPQFVGMENANFRFYKWIKEPTEALFKEI